MVQYIKYFDERYRTELEETKKRKPKERHLSAFAKGAIIYTLSLTALFAVLIGVLAVFLGTYEKNLPEKVAERFTYQLKGETMSALVKEAAGELGEFETPELLIERTEHLSGEIRQAKLAKEYTAAVPTYRLICGEGDIGKLTLRRAEKDAAFGIAGFEVDTVTLYPESVPGAIERTSVRICVPSGAALTVNGIAASEKYITERGVSYTGRTLVTGDTLCDIYVIDRLCLVPELEVEWGGTKSVLCVSSGRADWFGEAERTFVLTVPSGADVSVAGMTPSESLAEGGELTEALNEFEKHLGDALPKTLSYTVLRMGEDEDISVSVGGKALEGEWFDDGKKLIYLYTDESKFSVSAVIPMGAELYINGIKASEEYIAGEKEFEGLSGVKYLSSDPEKLTGVHYEIGGFLCEPSITAKIGDAELPLCSLSRNEQTFSAEFYGMTSDTEAIKTAADSFIRTYFNYVANGAVGIEENYNALIALMKNGSPGYKQIQRSKGSFEFVNQGTYRIDLIKPENVISLGGGLTYCEAEYSVNLRFYRNEKLYAGRFSLVFVKENAGYFVCDMSIAAEG